MTWTLLTCISSMFQCEWHDSSEQSWGIDTEVLQVKEVGFYLERINHIHYQSWLEGT